MNRPRTGDALTMIPLLNALSVTVVAYAYLTRGTLAVARGLEYAADKVR